MHQFILATLLALSASVPAFADNQGMGMDDTKSTDCEAIAKACLDAGFSRTGGEGKAFWHDCMKPVLFGEQVSGVKVDVKEVKACRQFKIKHLEEQVQELKKHNK